MRCYLKLVDLYKCPSELTVDGIQLELKRDIDSSITKGSDIFLDFFKIYYMTDKGVKVFRLAHPSIMIDGESCDLDEDSEEMYNLVRNSKFTEIVLYNGGCSRVDKYKILGSLEFNFPNNTLHLKSNKVMYV